MANVGLSEGMRVPIEMKVKSMNNEGWTLRMTMQSEGLRKK
jgi:hypothetical protein